MRPAPRVSVIISTYNGERYLLQAIAGFINQTYEDFELIVVNDGSDDATADILDSINDDRLRVITNTRNMGIGASQNRALAVARGKYLAIQDHDDISEPNRLKTQVAFLDVHPSVSVLGSNCQRIGRNGEALYLWHAPLRDIDVKWQMIFGNPLAHTSLMLRRNAVESVCGYSVDPIFRCSEDYEFLSRLTSTGQFVNLEEPLVRWREHSASFSAHNDVTQRASLERIACRNINLLTGGQEINESLWNKLQVMLRSRVGVPVDLTSEDVRGVTLLLRNLLTCFHRRYTFPARVAADHYRRTTTLWGRHWLALSIKRNGKRDIECRRTLFYEGVKLLTMSFDSFVADAGHQRWNTPTSTPG